MLEEASKKFTVVCLKLLIFFMLALKTSKVISLTDHN